VQAFQRAIDRQPQILLNVRDKSRFIGIVGSHTRIDHMDHRLFYRQLVGRLYFGNQHYQLQFFIGTNRNYSKGSQQRLATARDCVDGLQRRSDDGMLVHYQRYRRLCRLSQAGRCLSHDHVWSSIRSVNSAHAAPDYASRRSGCRRPKVFVNDFPPISTTYDHRGTSPRSRSWLAIDQSRPLKAICAGGAVVVDIGPNDTLIA